MKDMALEGVMDCLQGGGGRSANRGCEGGRQIADHTLLGAVLLDAGQG